MSQMVDQVKQGLANVEAKLTGAVDARIKDVTERWQQDKERFEQASHDVAERVKELKEQNVKILAEKDQLLQAVAELRKQQEAFEAGRQVPFVDPALHRLQDNGELVLGRKLTMTRPELKEVCPQDADYVKAVQTQYDNLILVSRLLKYSPQFDGVPTATIMRQTKTFRGLCRLLGTDPTRPDALNPLRKAMDTAETGAGKEWLPTMFSADLIDRVNLEEKIAGLFEKVPMPTASFTIPRAGSACTLYIVAEATAAYTGTSTYTESDPGTGSVTLTAKKLGIITYASRELEEDSIIAMLPYIKSSQTVGFSKGLESSFLSGDTSTTHMDSNVTSASDRRKAWKALRYYALNGTGATNSKKDIGTFTWENFAAIRVGMRVYGVKPSDLCYIAGASGYLQCLDIEDSSGNPRFATVDKYGADATNIKGELGKMGGIPIIVSDEVEENLNATGVYDGTTATRTYILLVYRPGWVIGDRRLVTYDMDKIIFTDQVAMTVNARMAFVPRLDIDTEGVAIVGIGYNLTA